MLLYNSYYSMPWLKGFADSIPYHTSYSLALLNNYMSGTKTRHWTKKNFVHYLYPSPKDLIATLSNLFHNFTCTTVL